MFITTLQLSMIALESVFHYIVKYSIYKTINYLNFSGWLLFLIVSIYLNNLSRNYTDYGFKNFIQDLFE